VRGRAEKREKELAAQLQKAAAAQTGLEVRRPPALGLRAGAGGVTGRPVRRVRERVFQSGWEEAAAAPGFSAYWLVDLHE
jgi:hypothetical protein